MTDWADDLAATLRNQEHAAQALRDERETREEDIDQLKRELVRVRLALRDLAAEKDKEIEALSCALETAVRKWQDMGDEIERLKAENKRLKSSLNIRGATGACG